MNGLQTLPQWRESFDSPRGSILGVIKAVYPIGKILALFVVCWLGDRYGRRVPMIIGLSILPIGAALQGGAVNLPMFILSRFCLGIGTTFIAHPSPILITELAYPTHRCKATSLYNTCFYIGAILAAWTTYGTFRLPSSWSWRIPSILQSALPALQAAIMYWVPESPRWLLAHGQDDKAREFLVKYHAGGDPDSPLVDFEMREISEALRLEKNSQEGTSGYYELIRTPANRRRTLITLGLALGTQWNGVGVVSYYLTLVLNTIGITEVSKQALINGMLQIYNWLLAIFGGALLVDRVGRRGLFLVATGGMCLAYIAWTILNSQFAATQNSTLGNAVLAFVFIYNGFYDIAWTPLPISYSAEIFPYHLRGRGITVYYLGSYSGLISSMFINPIAMEALGWKYYIVFTVILFLLFVGIYFGLPETKGRTLEEIAEIFDGPALAVDGNATANLANKGSAVVEVERAPTEIRKTEAAGVVSKGD